MRTSTVNVANANDSRMTGGMGRVARSRGGAASRKNRTDPGASHQARRRASIALGGAMRDPGHRPPLGTSGGHGIVCGPAVGTENLIGCRAPQVRRSNVRRREWGHRWRRRNAVPIEKGTDFYPASEPRGDLRFGISTTIVLTRTFEHLDGEQFPDRRCPPPLSHALRQRPVDDRADQP